MGICGSTTSTNKKPRVGYNPELLISIKQKHDNLQYLDDPKSTKNMEIRKEMANKKAKEIMKNFNFLGEDGLSPHSEPKKNLKLIDSEELLQIKPSKDTPFSKFQNYNPKQPLNGFDEPMCVEIIIWAAIHNPKSSTIKFNPSTKDPLVEYRTEQELLSKIPK